MTGQVRALSVGQRAQWLLYALAPDSAANNVVQAAAFAPALDLGLLRGAVRAVELRHDMLRSTFTDDAEAADGTPVRVVQPEGLTTVEVRDVGDIDETALLGLVREAGQEPFRLRTDGPLRVVVLVRSVDCVLVVATHHIATDGLSQRIIWRDLGEAYRALRTTGTVDWPAPEVTYDEFVARENAVLDGPRRAELSEFWARTCAGAEAATLPTDRPRPERPAFRGATLVRQLPDELVERLRVAASAAAVTPFSVLLGAFESMLHRHTGQGEFTIGCPASTRRARALRDVVGLQTNTIVLRSSFGENTTFADAIAGASRQLGDGMAHASYPFALIQSDRPSRDPLVRVAITMLTVRHGDTMSDRDHGFVGHRARYLHVPDVEGQFDLGVEITRTVDGELRVKFRYDTELFDEATAARMLDHYLRLLEVACTAPDTPVSLVPLVDESEQRLLLALGAG